MTSLNAENLPKNQEVLKYSHEKQTLAFAQSSSTI